MQARLDLLTLAVPDVAAARRFYVEGLGWRPVFEVPGEIVFLQLGHGLLVGLWGAADLAADMGLPAGAVSPGGGLSLAHNVGSPEEVRRCLDDAVAAGGRLLKPAQPAAFGGFHGYFADPAGIRWEVAHNPGWAVADDGTVTLGPVGG
ncbi:VOC family protein [Geodermatophilus sp. SYSU D00758]